MANTGVITSASALANSLGNAEFLQAAFLKQLSAQLAALEPLVIQAQAVGIGQTAIPHTLGRIPYNSLWVTRATGMVWRSAPDDATNCYLIASVATTVDLTVQ